MKVCVCFIVCLTLIYAYSCKSNKPLPANTKCGTNPIIKYKPFAGDTSSDEIKRKVLGLAGLEDLENGFNEQQVRIWFTFSSPIENLLILSKTAAGWSGSYEQLNFQYDADNGDLISIKRASRAVTPRSGWKFLADSLYKLEIYNLPDMSQIPGYELERDGHWITVEYADCKSYRIYRYQSPWGYEKQFWQAAMVTQISRLAKEQFDISQR